MMMRGGTRIVIIILGLAIIVVLVRRGIDASRSSKLPVYGVLPNFSFTNHSGKSYGTLELSEKAWVANFVFTRCVATCPIQTSMMEQLQNQLSSLSIWKNIRLVSFSVDPEHDTVKVLKDYAEKAGVKHGYWNFLTAPRLKIWELSKKGFNLDVGESPPNAATPLFHSPKMVLIDREGKIRGYFSGMSKEGNAEILKALKRLFRE